jgi:membrane protein required for colicin V production
MIETHLNIFDATVIGILALSCLFAFFRGFVREILSLGAWIGAAIVTLYYFPEVAEKLQPHFKSPVVAAGVGTLGIYVTALVCFSIINMFILKFMKEGSDVGMLDNLLGLLFGAFRGAFIVSLGFFMITMAMHEDEYPHWISQSVTHPYVEKGALVLARMAPDYLREVSTLQKKAEEQARAVNRYETYDEPEAGYSNRGRQQLNRMIESTEER